MVKTYLLILLYSFMFLIADGQNTKIDSLNNIINQAPEDSTKVIALIELAENFYKTSATDAVRLGTQAKELAEKINYLSGLGYAYKSIGMGYYFQSNFLEALFNWQQALNTFKLINHSKGIANMLNNLGAVYFNEGDDEKAIDYYLESLREAEKINDSLRIATALVNIGAVYSNKDATREMSEDYYLRSLPISKALGDYDALGTVSVNLGELYLIKGDDVSALKYLENALEISQESATGNVPYALNAIGKVYAFRGDYSTAARYHIKAHELAKETGAELEMSQALSELSKTLVKQNDLRGAIKYFKRAEKLASKNDFNNELLDIYENMASTYAKMNDFSNAYNYQKLYVTVKEELFDAEMLKKIQTESLSYDLEKRQAQIEYQELTIQRQKTIRNGTAILGILLLLLAINFYSRFSFTKKTNKIIAFEKERSEKLLLNILPEETAEELKNKGTATPKYYETVSVLFTDFKGFTKIAEKLTPAELIEELNNCFLEFDRIIDKYNLEKIKTIGDAYMCAGGIPSPNTKNPFDMVNAGLEIKDYMDKLKLHRELKGENYWELRIGIHTGPVIAGVVGKNKFAYDIWGDAVNTASRMESSGIVGKVNISGETYEIVKEKFNCIRRGKIQAKNKGEVEMYIVESAIS